MMGLKLLKPSTPLIGGVRKLSTHIIIIVQYTVAAVCCILHFFG